MKIIEFNRKTCPVWWNNFVDSCEIYTGATILYTDYNAIVDYNNTKETLIIEFIDDDLYIEFLLRWA